MYVYRDLILSFSRTPSYEYLYEYYYDYLTESSATTTRERHASAACEW